MSAKDKELHDLFIEAFWERENDPSWDKYISGARKKLSDTPQSNDYLKKLENAWQNLLSHYENAENGDINSVRDEGYYDEHKHPASVFSSYVNRGYFPPPEIILYLATSFGLYFAEKGERSLDEIFFGKPTKSIGNFSAKVHKERQFKTFRAKVKIEKLLAIEQDRPHKSLEKLAERFCAPNKKGSWKKGLDFLNEDDFEINDFEIFRSDMTDAELDAESFLRSYRRWLKK